MRLLYRTITTKVLGLLQSLKGADSPLLQYVDRRSLLPPSALLRLGSAYGGWVIPADTLLGHGSVCYSAGAGEDISFDCSLVERYHCQVRVIDPTPRAIEHFNRLEQALRSGGLFPINNSQSEHYTITKEDFRNIRLLPIGLSNKDAVLKFFLPKNPAHVSCSTANLQKTNEYFTAKCCRFLTIMKQQGDMAVDLLKMDIEGAEYGVIEDLVGSNQLPKLLLIEFDEVHSPQDASAGERIKCHIDMILGAGMRCIAVEGSNITFMRKS
jgi:FkbM family methyltransferase